MTLRSGAGRRRPGGVDGARWLTTVFVRLLLGDTIAPSLWPIMWITLFSTATFAGLWSYAGVWAVTSLHASATAVGGLYLSNAVACGITGFAGGRLSDAVGPKRVMVTGWALASVLILLLPLCAGHPLLAIAVAVLAMAAGAPATSASNVAVADLAEPQSQSQERAYASTRVMFNIGSTLGPPMAALLLLVGNWSTLFAAMGGLGLLTVTTVIVILPALPPRVQERGNRPPGRVTAGVLADRKFLLLLLSTALGYAIYVTFSSVLPVVAVEDYGLAPAAWGFLYAVNPVIVILAQLRITRATQRFAPDLKITVASLLMGAAFLLLVALPNAVGVLALTVVFVVGEMLWAPVSQALVIRMAPDHLRGSYLGAFRGAGQIALGLAPFLVLRLHSLGDDVTWWAIGLTGVLAAAVGRAAARGTRAAAAPDAKP